MRQRIGAAEVSVVNLRSNWQSMDGSVTHWIAMIKDGDQAAAQRLWERYFSRLVRLARTQLHGGTSRVSDEEDVAISVFDKFFRASEEGRFPDLADRDSLWRLLVRMTAQKAIDHQRREGRQRRGGEHQTLTDEGAIAQVIGDEPTPEFCALMAERFQELLSVIEDPELQELALGKMEGYSNEEMAQRLGCSVRTIERRLRLIRVKCSEQV